MLKTRKIISIVLVVAMLLSVCAVGIFSAGAVADGYFLVGSINGDNSWADGAHDDLQFTENAEAPGEYMLLGVSLSEGDALKVCNVNANEWYPDGVGNDYSITATGTYDFYFRPDGQGGEEWYNGYFYVDGPKEGGDTQPDTQGDDPQPQPGEGGYYVVGSMNSWTPDAGYMLTKNDAAETDEYQISGVALTTSDMFKIAYSADGATIQDTDYFPDGMGNGYGENGEITEDGTYNIYFRPNGDGGEDWFNSVIYVEAAGGDDPQPETQGDDPQPGETAIIVDGVTYPVEVGKTYTFVSYLDASKLPEGKISSYEATVYYDNTKIDNNVPTDDPEYDGTQNMPLAKGDCVVNKYESSVFLNASTRASYDAFNGEKKIAIQIPFTVNAEGTSTITSTLTSVYNGTTAIIRQGEPVDGAQVGWTSELIVPEQPTQAPETQAPETQAPETQAPETQAPETEAPETQAPETQAPVGDKAIVKIYDLKGNLSDTREFQIGDKFTVITYLNAVTADSPSGKVQALDAHISYTSPNLVMTADPEDSYEDEMFPLLGTKATNNFPVSEGVAEGTNELQFNYTVDKVKSAAKFDSDDSILAKVEYEVKANGVAEVKPYLVTLAVAETDDNLVRIVFDGKVEEGKEIPTTRTVFEGEEPSTEAPETEPVTEAPETEPVTEAPQTEPAPTSDYYVTGSITGWAVDPAYNMAKSSDDPEEYSLTLTLTAGDEIKVCNGDASSWYPDGMGNNYVAAVDGEYTVIVRPNGDGEADWIVDTTGAPVLKVIAPEQPETQGEDTQAPDTQGEDTQAPDTQGEETQAPDTQGEETQVTEAPETQAPALDKVIVIFDGDTEHPHAYDRGEEFAYTYFLYTGGKVGSLDAHTDYDSVLTYEPFMTYDEEEEEDVFDEVKTFPRLQGGSLIYNYDNPGTIIYNFTHNKGVKFDAKAEDESIKEEKNILINAQFKVADDAEYGVYYVNTNIVTLADENDQKIVFEGETIEGKEWDNDYVVDPDNPWVGPVIPTEGPTEAPETQAPVTEAPVTEAPVTEAPVTEAPVTEAPVTEAPVTEAPATDAPATEAPATDATSVTEATSATSATSATAATSATTAKTSTSSTATTTNTSSVKTGSTEMAIIFLLILVSAAGVVMFVRRRKD